MYNEVVLVMKKNKFMFFVGKWVEIESNCVIWINFWFRKLREVCLFLWENLEVERGFLGKNRVWEEGEREERKNVCLKYSMCV